MSFDVVVLNPDSEGGLLTSLDDIGELMPLGTRSDVRDALMAIYPSIDWSDESLGSYTSPQGFSLDLNILGDDDEAIESLLVQLHFGETWETTGLPAFGDFVQSLYRTHGWQSFSASDNSALLSE